MHRMNPDRFHTRPNHEDTQESLLGVIAMLEITVKANESFGTAVRQEAISAIESARRELERCTFSLHDAIRYLHDERFPSHMELVQWLNQLSIDLKLMDANLHVAEYPLPITIERLDEGKALVVALDNCRRQIKFY